MGKTAEKDTLYNSGSIQPRRPHLLFWLHKVLLPASPYINLQPPARPPHLHLDGSLYCSPAHCNVSLTSSLCTGRQDCLFLCPALPPSLLSPRTPALIASDHQYVAAADVSLLNLRREHNQPHLLQFFLSTGGPPPRRNHLCSPLSLCGKPPYPRAKKSHNSYSS